MLHANSSEAIRLSIRGRKYLLYKKLFNALQENTKINSNLRTRVHIDVLSLTHPVSNLKLILKKFHEYIIAVQTNAFIKLAWYVASFLN
jgi:hypothetical protein